MNTIKEEIYHRMYHRNLDKNNNGIKEPRKNKIPKENIPEK